MFSPPQLIPDALLLTTYPPKYISLLKRNPTKRKLNKQKIKKTKIENKRKGMKERKEKKRPTEKKVEFVLCWPTTLEPESTLEGALYWTQ